MTIENTIDRAYDAICEAAGRTNTATAVVRELVMNDDLVSLGRLATMIRQRTRDTDIEKRRMQILRVITGRVCKEVERSKLGYKLNKTDNTYACVEIEGREKAAKDEVLEALAIVLDNLDRADVMAALADAIKGK